MTDEWREEMRPDFYCLIVERFSNGPDHIWDVQRFYFRTKEAAMAKAEQEQGESCTGNVSQDSNGNLSWRLITPEMICHIRPVFVED